MSDVVRMLFMPTCTNSKSGWQGSNSRSTCRAHLANCAVPAATVPQLEAVNGGASPLSGDAADVVGLYPDHKTRPNFIKDHHCLPARQADKEHKVGHSTAEAPSRRLSNSNPLQRYAVQILQEAFAGAQGDLLMCTRCTWCCIELSGALGRCHQGFVQRCAAAPHASARGPRR